MSGSTCWQPANDFGLNTGDIWWTVIIRHLSRYWTVVLHFFFHCSVQQQQANNVQLEKLSRGVQVQLVSYFGFSAFWFLWCELYVTTIYVFFSREDEELRTDAQRQLVDPYLSCLVRLLVVDFDEHGRKAQMLPAMAAKHYGILFLLPTLVLCAYKLNSHWFQPSYLRAKRVCKCWTNLNRPDRFGMHLMDSRCRLVRQQATCRVSLNDTRCHGHSRSVHWCIQLSVRVNEWPSISCWKHNLG